MAAKKKDWAALVGKYAELPPDASYVDAMIARVDELRALPIDQIAEQFEAARAASALVASAQQNVDFEEEALQRAFVAHTQRLGVDGMTVGGRYYEIKPEPYATVKDKVEFMTYALKEHAGNLMMHHSTLNAIVKSSLRGEGDMPPGLEIFMKHKLSNTKA